MAVSLVLIGLATLWPVPSQAPLSAATPFLCLPCGESGLSDLLLNIVLFIPLGLALSSTGSAVPKVVLVSSAISIGVELMQLTVIPGRDASLADIVSNTVGGALGGRIGASGVRALFPGVRVAAALAGGWAALGAVAAGVTAWSFQPSFRESTWYGQWAPDESEPEWFDGEVITVRLGSRPLPHWRLGDSQQRRLELLQDTIRLSATIVSITPPEERLRIVAVADSAGRLATLSQQGQDIHFSVRTRAADLFLESPRFQARGALPATAGNRMAIEGLYWRGWGAVQGLPEELSPLDGWSLLVGMPVGSGLATLATVLWLVGWFVPIGFYGGQLRTSAWAAAPAWLLLAVPVAISMLIRAPFPAPWEVAVGALAALLGRVLCAGAEARFSAR